MTPQDRLLVSTAGLLDFLRDTEKNPGIPQKLKKVGTQPKVKEPTQQPLSTESIAQIIKNLNLRAVLAKLITKTISTQPGIFYLPDGTKEFSIDDQDLRQKRWGDPVWIAKIIELLRIISSKLFVSFKVSSTNIWRIWHHNSTPITVVVAIKPWSTIRNTKGEDILKKSPPLYEMGISDIITTGYSLPAEARLLFVPPKVTHLLPDVQKKVIDNPVINKLQTYCLNNEKRENRDTKSGLWLLPRSYVVNTITEDEILQEPKSERTKKVEASLLAHNGGLATFKLEIGKSDGGTFTRWLFWVANEAIDNILPLPSYVLKSDYKTESDISVFRSGITELKLSNTKIPLGSKLLLIPPR